VDKVGVEAGADVVAPPPPPPPPPPLAEGAVVVPEEVEQQAASKRAAQGKRIIEQCVSLPYHITTRVRIHTITRIDCGTYW
jgi:hypothetical protein